MGKRPFTTRIDEEVLAVAQRLADIERRSVTSLIEVAVLAYAARCGVPPLPQDGIPDPPVGLQDGTVTGDSSAEVSRTKKPHQPKSAAISGRATRGDPRNR